MKHKHYFEIAADSYFDLGLRQGELFRPDVQASIAEQKRMARGQWAKVVERSKPYLEATNAAFPNLVEEARGYAEGARVSFEDLWIVLCEDELSDDHPNKCTTIVTNEGALLAHNEDWAPWAEDYICVLRKSVKDFSVLELHYIGTLGGNSISINSHGFVHAINTLTHADAQVGVPRNMVARWLSQTSDPERDFARLQTIKRSSGYHHTLLNNNRKLWSIECSALRQVLKQPGFPFVHTNHYLTDLDVLEHDDGRWGSYERYERARRKVQASMSDDAVKIMANDDSDGARKSIFNKRTIGRMIVDFGAMTASVWLRREKEAGWLTYSLDDFRG